MMLVLLEAGCSSVYVGGAEGAYEAMRAEAPTYASLRALSDVTSHKGISYTIYAYTIYGLVPP